MTPIVHGRSSVVPDSPGLRETVKDGVSGYIYPFGDKKMLSEILVKILKDRRLALEMGKKARRWAVRFSWDESAEKMKEIILSQL